MPVRSISIHRKVFKSTCLRDCLTNFSSDDGRSFSGSSIYRAKKLGPSPLVVIGFSFQRDQLFGLSPFGGVEFFVGFSIRVPPPPQ